MLLSSKLDIYLFKQLIILLIFTVSLLSAVGVAIGTISELAFQISNYNLPLVIALKIFLLKIPEYVAYGLPIGTLLSTLIVYGRLNQDGEIIAFRSVGISIYRVIFPAVVLSLVITLITFLFNEAIASQANSQVTILQEPFLPETTLTLQRKDIFYPEYVSSQNNTKQLKRLYYARQFDGKKLQNVLILNWVNGQLTQIIRAKSAFWHSALQSWQLEDGSIHNLGDDTLTYSHQNFVRDLIALPVTFFKIANQERDPDIMSLKQASDYLSLIKDTGDLKQIRLFQVRIQQKIAFPFICIIFALIGSALGTSLNNLNRGKSFGLCVLIAFGYYIFGFAIGSLGIAGLIAPMMAAWIPNFIAFGFSCWLLKMSNG